MSGDVLDGGEPVLEPVAGSVDRDDVAVVQEPIEDGGGQHLVAEDLAPFIWGWLMFVLVGLLLVPGQKGCLLIY